jgi:hypothetical protein
MEFVIVLGVAIWAIIWVFRAKKQSRQLFPSVTLIAEPSPPSLIEAATENPPAEGESTPEESLFEEELEPNPTGLSQFAGPAAIENQIVSRTQSNNSGTPYRDTWIAEKAFSLEESLEVIREFQSGAETMRIAIQMGIDHKDIIIHLTRTYFDYGGPMEDLESATNNRRRWTVEEHEILLQRLGQHKALERISHDLGRTPLALGWRIFSKRLVSFGTGE